MEENQENLKLMVMKDNANLQEHQNKLEKLGCKIVKVFKTIKIISFYLPNENFEQVWNEIQSWTGVVVSNNNVNFITQENKQ